ncbi:MAG TPA: molybdopterin-synthase adenylyltransferase MoeB [Candidatus Xenobia bacterium]|jgi:adenylyltransferase/sulfurtransferase
MPSWNEMLRQVKERITETTVAEVAADLKNGAPPRVIDIREQDEWEQGHLENATFIPRGFLEMKIERTVPDKSAPVVLYCAGGVRSAMAAAALQDLGYEKVLSMKGGFSAWKEAGLPFKVETNGKASPLSRYSRHLLIPEVGEAGQRKLLASKVLLIGAGGLGSPSALYLAAAGVGTLGLVDSDLVDETNLQRQILHKTRNVGMPKVDSARETLYDLNPGIKVHAHNMRMTQDNAEALITQYDLVVDGCDNFNTRYLVNDICVKHDMPNIYASIFRFDGQATVFMPHDGPCYRCLYPEPTPAEMAPNCQEAGVLGVLPGILGLIQATEAIKILLKIGQPLKGRLLTYDALEQRFKEFKVPRDPQCEACGPNANIDELLKRPEIPVHCAAPARA